MGMSKIAAQISLDASGMKTGANQAAAAVARLRGDMTGLKESLGQISANTGITALLQIGSAAKSAVSSLTAMASRISETVDGLSKASAAVGVSYANLSGFALAADLSGSSTQQLVGAMQRANRMFAEASRGSVSAISAFDRLGLSVADLANASPDQRFKAIADAVASMDDPAQRVAAAMAVFGRSGADLLPLLSGGAAALEQSTTLAQRLGLALTDLEGTGVERMNDALSIARKTIDGMVTQLTAGLAPAIESAANLWTNSFTSANLAGAGAALADSLTSIGGGLAESFSVAAAALSPAWDDMRAAGEYLRAGVGDVLSGLFERLRGLIERVGATFATLWEPIKAAFEPLFGVGQEIGGAMTTAVGYFDAVVAAAWGPAMAVFRISIDGLRGVLAAAASTFYRVQSAFSAIVRELLDAAGWIAEKVWGGDAAERFKAAAGGADAAAQASWLKAEAAAGEAMRGFGDAGRGMANFWELSADLVRDAEGRLAQAQIDGKAALEALTVAVLPSTPAIGGEVAAAVTAGVEAGVGKIASAVDARSKEGVKEMITAMYGTRSTIEEQQLQVQERMADALDALGDREELEFEVGAL